ncbi:MAG: MBL fold metallo-hydrolase [Oscillospiraceae bacterium]|nr:MBL fold metallo-hydrolase [Oscillospiraceae bacterium]
MSRTKVVMLGSGTPNPIPDRSGPCVAIVVDETAYLVDFGSNVVRQAEKARRMGIKGLTPNRLNHAFLTHLHSDHAVGIADLILIPWVLEREKPLKLVGPEGILGMAEHTIAAFAGDIAARQEMPCPTPEEGYKTEVVNAFEGIVHQDELVTVEAFLVNHPPFEAYGYRFTTPDRVIVVSGDTAPSDNLIKYATNCDVLVHEVVSAKNLQKRTPDWFAYHSTVHTTCEQLGEIAKQANPGMLVLYHQLFMCGENESGNEVIIRETELEVMANIRKHYGGPVFSSKDLDIF